jgi:preprotein translocase subunit SecE
VDIRVIYHRETVDVAKTKAVKKATGGNAIVRYLRDTRAELRKVRWPTRQEAWGLTRIVLVVTVAMALFMGLLDYLFSLELSGLVGKEPVTYAQHIIAVVIAVVALVGTLAAFVVVNLRGSQ